MQKYPQGQPGLEGVGQVNPHLSASLVSRPFRSVPVEIVPHPPLGTQEGGVGRVGLHLLPNAADVDIHRPVLPGVFVAPHQVQQLFPARTRLGWRMSSSSRSNSRAVSSTGTPSFQVARLAESRVSPPREIWSCRCCLPPGCARPAEEGLSRP